MSVGGPGDEALFGGGKTIRESMAQSTRSTIDLVITNVLVLDPVDGSTNCARGIPYWAISLCALDADGPWVALVQHGATGARYSAVRGEGAHLDRATIAPAALSSTSSTDDTRSSRSAY